MKKSLVTMIAALALVGVVGAGATLAYLTDTTDSVTNKFTVGNVNIELTEWNGSVSSNDGFEYKDVIPGTEYDKKPIVTVKANSAESYVFVKIENENGDNLKITDISEELAELKGVAGVYYKEVAASEKDEEITVFTKVTVGTDVEEGTKIEDVKVTAYAIQKAGFENDVKGAWEEVSKAK